MNGYTGTGTSKGVPAPSLDTAAKLLEPEAISIDEYVEVLKRDGAVAVRCPHGKGQYFISLTSNTAYGTPDCIFQSADKNDQYGLKAAPAYLRTNHGRHILWYPIGLGFRQYADSRGYAKDRDKMIALAKMLIGMILCGRRLYAMHCGENINSWNTDDDLQYKSYYDRE